MIIIVKNTSNIDKIVSALPSGSYTVVDATKPVMLPANCSGIIIGGSKEHVYRDGIPIGNIQSIVQGGILRGCPILGICYGMQLLSVLFGGEVSELPKKMTGEMGITYEGTCPLFNGLVASSAIFNNEDIVSRVPKGFKMVGYVTGTRKVVAIHNNQHKIFGVQFHPEEKIDTKIIIKNFAQLCIKQAVPVQESNNMNALLIEKLTEVCNIERTKKQYFKVRAYLKVIDQIKASSRVLKNIEDIDSFEGIGKSIKDKIQQIMENGEISGIDKDDVAMTKVVELLTKVHGVGVVKAQELYKQHGIKSIDEMRAHAEHLNDVQLLGLKYYEDIEKRIPRKEMDRHKDVLATALVGFKYEIAGSYRRGQQDSGDIDLIISWDDTKSLTDIVTALKKQGYIKDDFAIGDKKYMGMARLPRFKTSRRLDILYTEPERYPFAILYFTGSQKFNIKMRNVALSKGYSLNEYGLKPIGGKKDDQISHTFNSEKDIFDFLGMAYVIPTER